MILENARARTIVAAKLVKSLTKPFVLGFTQIGYKNMENVEQLPLTLDKAVQLVKDVFVSAAERDVYTGDALKICIITKEGIREENVPLRRD